jgi:LysR family transcriptional regulator, nod-box dependent transcriptional activator
VVAGRDDLTDDNAARLLADRPHVVYESRRTMRPYDILRERGIEPAVHTRVADTLMTLHLIAGSDRVGVHRRRVAEMFARESPLWLGAFPFPAGTLGLDVVWNPWLGDSVFREWFTGLLVRAVTPS